MNDSKIPIAAFCWFCILGLGYAVYFPALSGSFLFDDYANLKALGLYGGVTDWETFKSFVFGGFSGPTGRPISLLTFLIDASNWPASPQSFKHSNLLLHLFNGTLVLLLTRQILRALGRLSSERCLWIAIVVAGLWLLHPYLISTTMYIVQRMAMLSAMFCMLGMIAYLAARVRVQDQPFLAYIGMTASIGLFTLLAAFSKENGAILAVLILCLESTVLRANPDMPALNRLWKWAAIGLPTLAIGFLLLKGPFAAGWFQEYSTRDFSPYERVLTQFRVVLSYLNSWFFPPPSGGQIFYDDLKISRSLLSPVSTLFALLLICTLIVAAIWKRRQWPLASFAILFFFASQAIESTTIGLELKFDHRVYLGSAFLFLPIVVWAAITLRAKLKVGVSLALIIALAGLTYSAASLWGNYQQLTMVWAIKHPDSVRSQTEAAQMLFAEGRPIESRKILDEASKRIPDDFRLRLIQVLLQCMTGGVNKDDLEAVKSLARMGPYRHTDFNLLNSLLSSSENADCRGISLSDAREITGALFESTDHTSRRNLAYAHLHYYYGLVLLQSGETKRALELLNESLESRSSLHMRMNIASYKASAGLFTNALKDARHVEERLESGEVTGRAAVEAPSLDDVKHFISVLEKDISEKQAPGAN